MASARNRIVTMGILAAAAAAAPAGAKEKDKAPPEIFQSLSACRAITEDKARLACFDTASAAFSTAVAQQEIVVLDKKQVQETRKGLFGFRLPKLPFFGGDDGDERGEDKGMIELTTTIKNTASMGNDKWRLVLADGATWVTTDPMLDVTPKPGKAITIKKAMFGSYNLSVAGSRVVKARREN